MKFRSNKKFTSCLLCMMLIVAMAFTTVGCGTKKDDGNASTTGVSDSQETQVVGEGKTKFLFNVVDKDGNETKYEIHTEKEMVGDALLELELIEGDQGAYGLYVKKVNGITADYDTDKTYWAFYVNGEYASSGVDTTKIEEGKTYTFKVEK
ncbi:MAG: DUF4430 domain-containing protein [Lachnospiraceae bacterium]|nr:DUF4430 domain-containing protein [Lachnospiraceae bacterium]